MSPSVDPNIRRQIRRTLVELYPDESSIRRVAADTGIDLSRVPLNSHPTNDWHRVLAEAEFVNQFDALVDVLEGEYAANLDVQHICEAYRQETEQAAHRDLVSSIERVGDQQPGSQVSKHTTEDDEPDPSDIDTAIQETFQKSKKYPIHMDIIGRLIDSDAQMKSKNDRITYRIYVYWHPVTIFIQKADRLRAMCCC